MLRKVHRESGGILKTALVTVLVAGAALFVLNTILLNQNGTSAASTTEACATVEPTPEAGPPPVNLDEIRAHRKRYTQYAEKVEKETAQVYEQLNARIAPWFEDGLLAVQLFGGFAVCGDFYGEGVFYASQYYANRARQKGCTDPLILSIINAYYYQKSYSTTLDNLTSHLDNIKNLAATTYPAIVKLEVDTAGILNLSYGKHKKLEALVPGQERTPELCAQIRDALRAVLQTDAPDQAIYAQLGDIFDAMQDDPPLLIKEGPEIEDILKHSKMSPAMQAACKGDYLISLAWASRGSGWSDTVTPQGWKGMADALDQAEQIINTAYEKYPPDVRLPTLMLTVELGQGRGQYRMDGWFQKAIAIDPNYYRAYAGKCYYLQPRWHGNIKECLQFGWECVKTGKWDDLIPMVFVENAATIAQQSPKIYQDKKLWEAVESTYEEFLKRYPNSLCYRTQYVDAAARAGRQ